MVSGILQDNRDEVSVYATFIQWVLLIKVPDSKKKRRQFSARTAASAGCTSSKNRTPVEDQPAVRQTGSLTTRQTMRTSNEPGSTPFPSGAKRQETDQTSSILRMRDLALGYPFHCIAIARPFT